MKLSNLAVDSLRTSPENDTFEVRDEILELDDLLLDTFFLMSDISNEISNYLLR